MVQLSHFYMTTGKTIALTIWSFVSKVMALLFKLCLGLSVTQSYQTLCNPWTVASQAPLSMECSRQEYWSGLPSSKGSSQPRDQTPSLRSPALAGRFFTTSATWEALMTGGKVETDSKICHRFSFLRL